MAQGLLLRGVTQEALAELPPLVVEAVSQVVIPLAAVSQVAVVVVEEDTNSISDIQSR